MENQQHNHHHAMQNKTGVPIIKMTGNYENTREK